MKRYSLISKKKQIQLKRKDTILPFFKSYLHFRLHVLKKIRVYEISIFCHWISLLINIKINSFETIRSQKVNFKFYSDWRFMIIQIKATIRNEESDNVNNKNPVNHMWIVNKLKINLRRCLCCTPTVYSINWSTYEPSGLLQGLETIQN